MQRAKSLGIDAFALNIGVDSYTDQQLGYAYESAANNDMKVFISFDFNWYSPALELVSLYRRLLSTQINQLSSQSTARFSPLPFLGMALMWRL